MSRARVYLCGPMAGLSLRGADSWRRRLEELLSPLDFECISPLRGKFDLVYPLDAIPGQASALENLPAISRAQGILGRDRWDVSRADVIFANFLGAERVSIGSCFELAWADALRLPTIVLVEPGSAHDHVFITHPATYVVSTQEEGISCLKIMFAAPERTIKGSPGFGH